MPGWKENCGPGEEGRERGEGGGDGGGREGSLMEKECSIRVTAEPGWGGVITRGEYQQHCPISCCTGSLRNFYGNMSR